MLQNAIQSARSQVVTWFSRHGNASSLDRMLELAMAAARCNQKPTIVIKHPQHLTNLHRTKNTALVWRGQSGLVVLLLNFKVDGRKAALIRQYSALVVVTLQADHGIIEKATRARL